MLDSFYNLFSNEKIKKFGRKKYLLSIYVFLLICQFIASYPVFHNMDWYIHLNKSDLTPESWVFRVVWSIIYLCMAFILYLYAKIENKKQQKYLIWLFFCQLIFNISWNYSFFYFHNLTLSFIHIILVDLLVIINILAAWRASLIRAIMLFIPYLFWIIYASFIMFETMLLNT